MNRSICLVEIIELLQITPGQTGLDGTLGYGGHTLEMLKCLNSKGHLYATDVNRKKPPNGHNLHLAAFSSNHIFYIVKRRKGKLVNLQ